MKGDRITLSQKQMQRFQVMGLVEAGKITLKEAAEKIGRSYRQAKRIWKRVREEGVKGVIHGNSGKPSNHRAPTELQQKVLQLSQRCYGEFNDTHFTEMLTEREKIELSRETVRKIRRQAGIGSADAPSEASGAQSPGGLDGSLGWQPAPMVRAGFSSLLFDGGYR
jgi:transposase